MVPREMLDPVLQSTRSLESRLDPTRLCPFSGYPDIPVLGLAVFAVEGLL